MELLNVRLRLVHHVTRGASSAVRGATRHDHRSDTLRDLSICKLLHLAALRAQRHVLCALIQIRDELILAEQGLRLFYHDSWARESLIQDVLVV